MKVDIQQIKQRFGIVGHSASFDRAISIAAQVAPTDLSVLVMGESGVGKEFFPKIIHENSLRKHKNYIAVNCGAIPEGTIDSELFGHLKGSFTGALSDRKGYFEEADGGTIFLDEVGELPLSTQARLLRVLENGEFIPVGASKAHKTDVRVVAATNVNMLDAVQQGKFREDLYFRLNSVPIEVPPLRQRNDDVLLLFRLFAAESAEKYRMPQLELSDDAKEVLHAYSWPGNIRELRNLTDRLSVLENDRQVTKAILEKYLSKPTERTLHPMVVGSGSSDSRSFNSEREILYQVLFDIKNDINNLKRAVSTLASEQDNYNLGKEVTQDLAYIDKVDTVADLFPIDAIATDDDKGEIADEVMTIEEGEKRLIIAALRRHSGQRKLAAKDLNISDRTLYRKMKEYELV